MTSAYVFDYFIRKICVLLAVAKVNLKISTLLSQFFHARIGL